MSVGSFSKFAATVAMALGLPIAGSAAHAASITVGTTNTGGNKIATFDNLPLGSQGGTDGGITVSFTPDGASVMGSNAGINAAPYGDTTPYVTTGTGTVDLKFSTDQNYLGLLWGSVDSYNNLTFLENGAQVAVISGAQVIAVDPTLAGSSQQADGTRYVNLSMLPTFNEVVASSSNRYAFEFDNVAYSAVPEPASLVMSGMAMLAVTGVALRRRNAKAAQA